MLTFFRQFSLAEFWCLVILKHAHRPFVTSNVALATGVNRVLYPDLMSSLLSLLSNGFLKLLVIGGEFCRQIFNGGSLRCMYRWLVSFKTLCLVR